MSVSTHQNMSIPLEIFISETDFRKSAKHINLYLQHETTSIFPTNTTQQFLTSPILDKSLDDSLLVGVMHLYARLLG